MARRAPLLVLKTCEAHLYVGLLKMGTFHAGRFKDDGTGEWLPLTFSQGLRTNADGLGSEADILIVPSSILGTVPALTIHRAPGPSGPSPHVPV
jgi:secreted PhoX family phosphatase